MSMQRMFDTVGAALGGVIGWNADAGPPADESSVRRLLADLGVPADGDLAAAVRRFQRHAGLADDGVAGPRTVHLLARHAAEARALHRLRLAA
jgi:Putative peptidoglycan binding domain